MILKRTGTTKSGTGAPFGAGRVGFDVWDAIKGQSEVSRLTYLGEKSVPKKGQSRLDAIRGEILTRDHPLRPEPRQMADLDR
jgi:hypothetical protein